MCAIHFAVAAAYACGHFFPAFRAIVLFWGQDPNGAAVFAQILLTAALISSIFHNVCAAACATLMLHRGDDHLTIFFEDDFFDKKIRVSFTVYHYQNNLYTLTGV